MSIKEGNIYQYVDARLVVEKDNNGFSLKKYHMLSGHWTGCGKCDMSLLTDKKAEYLGNVHENPKILN